MDLTKKTVVFSKTDCPYCDVAKNVLNEHGIDFETVQVNVDMSKEDMQSIIQKVTGVFVETVPQVFIDGDYIGGSDDLIAHLGKEKMKLMLKSFQILTSKTTEVLTLIGCKCSMFAAKLIIKCKRPT